MGGGGGGGSGTDAGNDAGTSDAGTDAGVGPFTFGTVSIPAQTGAITGLGEAAGAIWAASDRGRVYRSTGGAFQEVLTLNDGSVLYALGMYVAPDGTLFVISTTRLARCASACDQAASWSYSSIQTADEVLESVCGTSATDVVIVASKGGANTGVAYSWNGGALGSLSSDIGATSPKGCWRSGATLYFAARSAVVRYASGSFTAEPADLLDAGVVGYQPWYGGGTINGVEHVVGFGQRIARREGGAWKSVFAGTTGSIRTLVQTAPSEAFAFGGGPSSSGQAAFRWDGSLWRPLLPDLPAMNVAHSVLLASDGQLYVGGDDSSSNVCVVRGTRQ